MAILLPVCCPGMLLPDNEVVALGAVKGHCRGSLIGGLIKNAYVAANQGAGGREALAVDLGLFDLNAAASNCYCLHRCLLPDDEILVVSGVVGHLWVAFKFAGVCDMDMVAANDLLRGLDGRRKSPGIDVVIIGSVGVFPDKEVFVGSGVVDKVRVCKGAKGKPFPHHSEGLADETAVCAYPLAGNTKGAY